MLYPHRSFHIINLHTYGMCIVTPESSYSQLFFCCLLFCQNDIISVLGIWLLIYYIDTASMQRLYQAFNENQYPKRDVKENLAKELGLTRQQVCTCIPCFVTFISNPQFCGHVASILSRHIDEYLLCRLVSGLKMLDGAITIDHR